MVLGRTLELGGLTDERRAAAGAACSQVAGVNHSQQTSRGYAVAMVALPSAHAQAGPRPPRKERVGVSSGTFRLRAATTRSKCVCV